MSQQTVDSGSVVALLLTAVVVLGGVGVYVSVTPAAAASTFVVDDDGGTGYQSIQSALDAASDGDTVEVRPGVYREAVSVDTAVTLVAPNGATLNGSTVPEPSPGAGTVGITVDPTLGPGLTIDGFTVEGYGDGIGVGTSPVEDSPGYEYNDYDEQEIAGGWTIQNVVVSNNDEDGVDVGPATTSAWTLRNVTAVDNGDDGIEAGGFGGTVAWQIIESNASVNRETGVFVGRSSGDWKILDSTTNGNFDGLGIGVYIVSRESDWTIGNHTATDNSFYGIDVAGSFSGAWTVHNSTLSDNGGSGLNANDDEENEWFVRDTNLSGNSDWGLRAGNAQGDFRVENVTVRDNTLGGIAVSRTNGQWRIDDSWVENNGKTWGYQYPGIEASYTLGSWAVNNTTITGNVNGGINAEDGRDGRPVGDATDNWWGQPGGPIDTQCVGNVDCSSPLDAPPGTSAPATATIEGRVTNASGDPVDGVDVRIYRAGSSGTFFLHETATTNASGQYEGTAEVPSGSSDARVKLKFDDPTETYAVEWFDDGRSETTATVLTVDEGSVTTADAELSENVATVYGWVRNESGDPLEGMLVVPYREDAGGDLRQLPGVGTNETGQYTYEIDVPSGQAGATVKLLFVDPDDVYASRYYDDAETLAGGMAVYIPAGERRLVSETLPREDDVTAGFSGTVTDEAGTPLEGIDVTVFRDDGTGTFREWTTEPTDAQGGYDIDVRPPDPDNALVRVKLRFTDPSGQYTELWYDGASERNADAVAGLVSAEIDDLNATLVDEAPPSDGVARVSGWVTNESGAPIDGALVVVDRVDETGAFDRVGNTWTDGTGHYAVDVDVLSGESSADVRVGFVDPDDVYATRYYDEAVVPRDATTVTVPGGETRFVSETLPREDEVTASYRGTVTNESGVALPGIEVTVFREDESGIFREYTTELTDAQGRYDINVRPAVPDDRRVAVKLRFTDPTWEYAQEWNSTSYRNVRTMADAAEVDAVVGGSRYRDEVLERNVVTVAGRVRNLDRDSLDGILVVPYRKEADGDFESVQSATAYTDEFGRYETEVPVRDGETTVDLKVGFVDPDDEYASLYWRNNTSISDAEVITADAGWELPNVRIDLPRRDDVSVTYLGTVYDENTEILEDIRVTVFRDDGTGTFREWTNVRTDENGYWEADVYPPSGESYVAAKIRYHDDDGDYVEEWEFNQTSRATADVKNGTVGDSFLLYGTQLAKAPTTQVSGVVRSSENNDALDGVRVTVYRHDGSGGFAPFATTTTDEFGYYEFQVPAPPGSSTVTTRLFFTDPAGEYASMWYRDARRYAESERMATPAGDGNYFNDQWLPDAGMILDVSVQALSTCPNPADESSCTFPNDADSVTVGPNEEVAVRYELWNGDDEVYTDYDVDDPATGTTMFGANHQIATRTTRTKTETLTSPLVDGSYDYRANATSVSESGTVSNSSATYTIGVQGSVVQQARVGDRVDASVSNAGTGTPVLVDGGTQGLVNLSNMTLQSMLLTTDGGDFSLDVTGTESAPAGTTPLDTDAAFGYVTVGHSISDDEVDEVVFRFSVSRGGLATAERSPGDVVLYRYVNGNPTALPTTTARTTSTDVVLEATSPGLSVFAVGTTDATEGGSGGPTAVAGRDHSGGDSDRQEPSPTPEPTATATLTAGPTTTATPEPTTTGTAVGGDETVTATDGESTGSVETVGTTSTEFPGFGPVAVLLALLTVSVALRSRRGQSR